MKQRLHEQCDHFQYRAHETDSYIEEQRYRTAEAEEGKEQYMKAFKRL